MTDINVWAALGFLLAAYAVVGNDALQTLGTFINSNGRLHWTVLFGFAATILVVTFTYGWFAYDGDPSFDRLSNVKKFPPFEGGVQWYHTLPAVVLLALTRFGVPVSTSFMMIAIVATMDGITGMIAKSLVGYGLAFAVGGVLYLALVKTVEKYFRDNQENRHALHWVVLQWLSTAWLWAVWLMQDFANIFVFLPRKGDIAAWEAFTALGVIVVLLAVTFANRGGPVQRILRSKTAVVDIRSATIVDFTFAGLLYYFKTLNNIPMSTTWVFLGLIAGREYAFALLMKHRTLLETSKVTLTDIAKAYLGLVISVDLARSLQAFAKGSQLWSTDAEMYFLLGSNLLVIPAAVYLFRQTRTTTFVMLSSLAAGAIAFFVTLRP